MIKGIYAIKNTKTGCIYIGSSLIVESRITDHFECLKNNKHSNYRLQRAYNRHKKYFIWVMLQEFKERWIDREKLYDAEQYWLDCTEKQYNILCSARGHLIKNRKKRLQENKKFKQRRLKL